MTTTSTVTTTITGPRLTLKPAVRFDFDLNNLANLQPAPTADVHFSGSGTSNGGQPDYVADLGLDSVYPVVVLDHSSFVKVLYDGASNLTVIFNDTASFAIGQTWIPGTVFMAYVAGYGNGGHIFFLSSVISPDVAALTLTITGSDIGLEGAVQAFKVDWGKFQPGATSLDPGLTDQDNTTTTANATLPSSTFNGTGNTTIPSCSFGSEFDKCLDDQLGYLDFSADMFVTSYRDFAPGSQPEKFNISDISTLPGLQARSLNKRWDFGDFVEATVDTIGDGLGQIAGEVVKVAKDLGKGAIKALSSLVNYQFQQTLQKTFSIEVPKKGTVQKVKSPFPGVAHKIYKDDKVAVYCIDCQVKGKITFYGHAAASLAKGLTAGEVGVNGNFLAGLHIGVDGKAKFSKQVTKSLYDVGIPGLSVPNIITLGPSIRVSAQLQVSLSAKGTLLVGAKLTLPAFKAKIDLLNGGKSTHSGFKPKIDRIFKASGQIKATADFGIPIGLYFGISILGGSLLDATYGLVDQPEMHATATFVASTNSDGRSVIGDAKCPGIPYELSFVNRVYITQPKKKNINLLSTTIPAYKGCVTLAASAPTAPKFGLIAAATAIATVFDAGDASSASVYEIIAEPTDLPDLSSSGDIASNLSTSLSDPSAVPSPTIDSPIATSLSSFSGMASATDIADVDQLSSSEDVPLESESLNPLDTTVDPTDEPGTRDDRDATIAKTLQDGNLTARTIIYAEASVMFKLSEDLNIYLDPIGQDLADPLANKFMTYSDVAYGAITGAFFHYYPDEISAHSVTRFRASKFDAIPKRADAVSLRPVSKEEPTLIAVDTLGNVFYIAACQISGRGTIIFLTKDPGPGSEKLMSPDLQSTITGGNATACFPVAMTLGEAA